MSTTDVCGVLSAHVEPLMAAFAEAFALPGGVVRVAVRPADDTDSPEHSAPVLLLLNATAADPDAVSAARERGARADFVAALADLLPPEVLEQVRLVFQFPHHPAAS